MADSFDPHHMVDIEGVTLTSNQSAMAAAFSQAATTGGPLVLHFHGGLVSGKVAREAANSGVAV